MIKNIILIIALLFSSVYATEAKDSNNSKVEEKEYTLIITGVKHLDKDDIAKALGVKSTGMLFWSKDNILKESFLKSLEPTLKTYLENKGYFDAKFTIDKNENNVTVNIIEGEPIKVVSIDIDSNFEIKKLITLKKGDVFEANKFVDIKDSIVTKLLENGHCKYKLDTKAYVDLKLHSAKLKYKLDKDGLCHFGKITIARYPKDIKKDVIYSRLKYKEGDKFDIRAIEDSYNSLNALNTFANLQIKYSIEDSNKTIDTTVTLDKRDKLKRYMLAIGVDSEVGARIKGSWEKRNFLGDAKKFTIKAQLAKDKQGLEAKLFAPAFLSVSGNYLDLYLSAGYELEKTSAYRQKRAYFDSHLDYSSKRWSAQAGVGVENLQINLYENLPYVIGGTFNLLYPYIHLTYDSRDSKLDPKNGIYLSAYSEYGISGSKGGVQYLKYLLEARAIKSFGDLTLSAVGKIGAIHEVSGRLPASKLFYGGGLFSNRAYGKNDIGIITSSRSFRKLGGKSYLNLQLEANYKLYKKLYGALFFDSTIINKEEYRFNGTRIDTVGFGLRYKTPIGPVKLDVGFNLHKKKDYAISIMLGQSF